MKISYRGRTLPALAGLAVFAAATAAALWLGAGMPPALAAGAPAPAADCCAVVELRQYVTYPGMRDTLVHLFEERFIESQEAVGIRVLGQFRDTMDPDHFTWLRGFTGMDARKQALGDFYYGPLWKANREAANATLYDNDNVLLLRPASPGSGFAYDPAQRPPLGAAEGSSIVVAHIYYFAHEVTPEFTHFFERDLMPLFEGSGAHVLARLVSEKSRNTFERLPVREDVNAFVWFARFSSRAAYDNYLARLGQDARWRSEWFAQLRKPLARPPEVLVLTPTARSALR